MKLHLEKNSGNFFKSFIDGECTIHEVVYRRSIIVSSDAVMAWQPQRFDDLTRDDFSSLLELQPELVLFGSGRLIRFPKPQLTQGIVQQHIGLEVMDSQAVCRTFNILAAENRRVVAALLLGDEN